MLELFSIDMQFEGKNLTLEGCIYIWDYHHRIEIQINTVTVTFELDKIQGYSVSTGSQQICDNVPSPELLSQVSQQLNLML